MRLDAGRRAYALHLAPYLAAAVLAWATVIVGSPIDWSLYAIATALLLLATALHLSPLRRYLGGTLSSFTFLAAVGVLRGSAGGINSGVAVVALIPVFYTALYSERRWLYVVLAGLALFYLAPILLVGPPQFPHSQYRAALLTVCVGVIIGLATQRLVSDVRHQAEAARDRERMLGHVATTDPLTGLPNRRTWDARVGSALSTGQRFTIAMLDLDRFKEFNDTHGHPAGDRLLKETAARWRAQLRSEDLLARLGGEEFGLLLLDCDTARATEVIERLRGLIPSGQTCSAGFASWQGGELADTVMARADAALYRAKQTGRDRVCESV